MGAHFVSNILKYNKKLSTLLGGWSRNHLLKVCSKQFSSFIAKQTGGYLLSRRSVRTRVGANT